MTNRQLTRQQFTDLILGREVTIAEIESTISAKYPECAIGARAISGRLSQLENSPHAVLQKRLQRSGSTRVSVYSLLSVAPEFFKLNHRSAGDFKVTKHKPKVEKTRYRVPMHPVEISY
ncbi:hypothetical protein [Serratia odorifera]|uniref:Transcriptional regulator n=2 Tax=Serratia odorifera TaxID=618 RepID=D4E7H1_SEROD|nr:hypothetical protein [Serratia odorifera]EFE94026.1 hypothetical protein HMPREF0758_4121 [Serratia odorifera DSM 4582]PNK89102.1 hypothetical protein CEQ31_004980 [Serratia odorifera]RII69868.1 hypothetical protein DX901_21315 [Serratia odorifera]VDZ64174.1 Uncharacterised protein [Serratia odorifera]